MFPTSLFRRNLFRTGLTMVAVSITVGCVFQRPEEVAPNAASFDAQAALKFATGFVIQNLVLFEIGFWSNKFGYTELLLRPRPDGNPTDWSLKDTVNGSDRTWWLGLKGGIAFQSDNPLGIDQSVALVTWHLANNKTVTEQPPGATVAVDQNESLLLTTQAPVSGLRNILTDEACFTIFDPPSYEGTDDDPQKLINAKIYIGPYVPVSLSDEKLVTTANPTCWNGIPGLGGVEVLFVPDTGARIRAVQSGEVDIALYPPTQQAKSLEDDTQAKFSLGESGGPSFCLTMNVAKPVLVEVKVRRAPLRLIDYRALATDVMQDFYEPVSSFYDPRLPYATGIWETDVAEAEQLLGKTGVTKLDSSWLLSSEEPVTLELLTYPQQPDPDTLTLTLQAQFKEHGIRATIRQVPDATAEMEGSNWDVGVVSNGTASFDGNPVLPLQRYYRTDGSRNYSHISDPELDALIDELAATLDEAATRDLLVRIQQCIGDQGYNGLCSRHRLVVVVGQRVLKYTPQHALIWVDAPIHVGV